MIWGYFAWCGIGNLSQIKEIITARDEGYVEVLCENLEESLVKLDLENNFIFQHTQDNDPKHKAKKPLPFSNLIK